MSVADFLSEVKSTLDDRGGFYGAAVSSFQRIADLWSPLLGQAVTPSQVAMCMIALKLARLTASPNHHDSVLDIAGYAALLSELAASPSPR